MFSRAILRIVHSIVRGVPAGEPGGESWALAGRSGCGEEEDEERYQRQREAADGRWERIRSRCRAAAGRRQLVAAEWPRTCMRPLDPADGIGREGRGGRTGRHSLHKHRAIMHGQHRAAALQHRCRFSKSELESNGWS